MPKGYYNVGPLRTMLSKARTQKVDIAGIWNSEGTYLANGILTGINEALRPRLGIYGCPAVSFGMSNNDDSAVDSVVTYKYGSGGVQYYWHTLGNGSTWTAYKTERTSVNATQLDFFNWNGTEAVVAPNFPGHAPGALAGWACWEIVNVSGRANPIPITDSMTATFWGAEFTTGGGSIAMTFRRADGAYTIVSNFGGSTSYAGTDGTMKKTEATVAADSSRSSWGGMQLIATSLTGKIFNTWMRVSHGTKTNGVAITPFYSRTSMSMYDMYLAVMGFTQLSYEHFFDVLTAHQGSNMNNHCVIFDLYEGSNFYSEGSVDAGAPVPGTANSPLNYVWYVQQIVAQIQGYWINSGRPVTGIAFRVSASHPINHAATEAGVDTYRAALKTGLRFNNQEARVTVMDRKELTPLTGMVAAGDFVDSTHLTYAGYVRTEQECWKPLLGSSWRQGRARSRVVGGSR